MGWMEIIISRYLLEVKVRRQKVQAIQLNVLQLKIWLIIYFGQGLNFVELLSFVSEGFSDLQLQLTFLIMFGTTYLHLIHVGVSHARVV